MVINAVADLGGVPGARPPKGSGFFRFYIQNFQNVTASGVQAPPPRARSTPPLREILDPPLQWMSFRNKTSKSTVDIKPVQQPVIYPY